MNKLVHMLLGSLLGLAGLLAGPAQAAPGLSPFARLPVGASDVVKVEVVCDRNGCYDTYRRPPPPPGWDDGYRRPPPPPIYRRPPPPPGWDDGYRRPPPPPTYRRPPPPPGWDDGYRRPPPPPIYRRPPPPPPPVYGGRRSSRHIEWCLNRYRSYNPQTNRFLSTDGYFKVCRSPYN
ncbi:MULTISPECIES: BA14K family protein [Alphaproteobacteria]|uniref:Lectin-like protein BA14k n=2 Tax=Alphaproteobacteria TaxID=28211 RepID=A0A512HE89_9HYPH|nr:MULTISPECIES: BA14K family protein [Alphaproteobacteria]GEO83771.1 hypothetical protein RNA01_07030 [Ciceribacter naphthalenivorans]GLR24077.1 hypothetical protein GCM10007920_38710 [Ciceribacter naphthalenivorans]GLT06933.1 hypothetical protein GCM10007926_38710 [Sphingomonas psychrolutea]